MEQRKCSRCYPSILNVAGQVVNFPLHFLKFSFDHPDPCLPLVSLGDIPVWNPELYCLITSDISHGHHISNAHVYLTFCGDAGTANISQEQKDFARKYSTPLDCTWIIRAEQQKVIYIQATQLSQSYIIN